ncbi:hypothetical protein FRC17_006711, partial [Serendipita sp. 399]
MSSNRRFPPRNFNNAVDVPRDVCREFWRSGTCARTPCRFRHERPAANNNASTTTNWRRNDANQPRELNHNRTSEQQGGGGSGLAMILQTMDAGGALAVLDGYCSASGSVIALPRAELLIRIIYGVAFKGSNWTHGKLRLQELLEWENVATARDLASQTMSFQLGYMTLLSLFCCEALVDSPLRSRCNELLSLLHQSYSTIAIRIVSFMDSMANNLSTRDMKAPNLEGKPLHHLLEVVTSLHKEYIQRFKSAVEDYPQIREMSDHLGRWLSVWSNNSISDPPDLTAQDKGRLVSKLRKDIGHLLAILGRDTSRVALQHDQQRSDNDNHAAERLKKELVSEEIELNPNIKDLLHRTFTPPGYLREGGPRHDNDHPNVVDIAIPPTQLELT